MTQATALRCTQRMQRKIEIDPILAFATQRDASATEGVHKLKRNATQRLASYCEPALRVRMHLIFCSYWLMSVESSLSQTVQTPFRPTTSTRIATWTEYLVSLKAFSQ